MNCLDNIIGLSRTECECQNPPSGYNESESGLFLDELEGFNLNVASGADDCNRGGLWDRMNKAVENAKTDFITNILGCIETQFKPRATIYSGQLAEAGFRGVINTSESYAGIKLIPNQWKGGMITLRRVGVLINQSVPVTIKIMRRVDSQTEEVATYVSPAPVVAGQLTWVALESGLELPMWSYSGKIEYFVLLQLTGFKPYENKRDCGCGNVKRPYLSWLNFNGTRGSNIDNLNSFSDNGNVMNGMILDVLVKCKTSEIICSSEMPLDFQDSGMAREMAAAIRFKAASKLYFEIASSSEINRYTVMEKDKLEEMAVAWEANYQKWIQYFCENINVSTNDCLVCKDNNQMIKGKILV